MRGSFKDLVTSAFVKALSSVKGAFSDSRTSRYSCSRGVSHFEERGDFG